MSSVFNTNLVFTGPYEGNYVSNTTSGYRHYWSWDAVILYGAGVNFSDQQHNNDRGPNYFSYFVKHVGIKGELYATVGSMYDSDYKLTVVLYKCPAKYENGNLVPIHTKGFINLENYILYSDPECILSWGVYKGQYRPNSLREYDFSLSCKNPFILGPNDLICCNVLLVHPLDSVRTELLSCNAKVVFDIN